MFHRQLLLTHAPSGKASSIAAYDAAGNRSAKRINFTIR